MKTVIAVLLAAASLTAAPPDPVKTCAKQAKKLAPKHGVEEYLQNYNQKNQRCYSLEVYYIPNVNKNEMWWVLQDVDAGKGLGMEWITIDSQSGTTLKGDITPKPGGGNSIFGEIAPGKPGVHTICGMGNASVGYKIVNCSKYSAYTTELLGAQAP